MDVVEWELLTPYGLRTLSPRDPNYRGRYEGDPRSRDSAYHQGTVWPWLLGSFLTAYVKVHGGAALDTQQEARDASRPIPRPAASSFARGRPGPDLRGIRRRLLRTAPAAASRRPGAWPKCCGRTLRTPRDGCQPASYEGSDDRVSRHCLRCRLRPERCRTTAFSLHRGGGRSIRGGPRRCVSRRLSKRPGKRHCARDELSHIQR